jgi:hypothetical protein
MPHHMTSRHLSPFKNNSENSRKILFFQMSPSIVEK